MDTPLPNRFRDRAKPFAALMAVTASMLALGYAGEAAMGHRAMALCLIPLVLLWFLALDAYTGVGARYRDRDSTAILAVVCAGMVAWLLYDALR